MSLSPLSVEEYECFSNAVPSINFMDVTGLSLMNQPLRRHINTAEFNWKARNFWVQPSPLFSGPWQLCHHLLSSPGELTRACAPPGRSSSGANRRGGKGTVRDSGEGGMVLPGVYISVQRQGARPGNVIELYWNLRVWFDGKDAVMRRVGRATPAGTVRSTGTAALSELAG